ncbi:MAG: hypothetical protein AB1806_19590 [Acidobacteriota bacterium]
MTRRALLRGALAAAGAGVASVVGLHAQKNPLGVKGCRVPFITPLGALDYIDRGQYIHNFEIHSFLEGVRFSAGEPLMTMWARGVRRMLPGGGGWIDITDPKKPALVKTSQRVGGCIAYNTRLKKWLGMSSAGQPNTSANPEHPYGRWDPEYLKQQTAYAGLRGIRTWDLTDPLNPKLLCEFSTGRTGSGTHHNFYDGGRYAYLDAGFSDELRMENAQRANSNALMIVDLTDPASVKEVSRWWHPGQLKSEEEEYKKFLFAGDESSWPCSHGAPTVPKRVEDGGNVGYGGFGHFGMMIFDFTDITKPKLFSKVRWDFETMGSIPYHTCYPVISDSNARLRGLVIGVPETVLPDCREPFKPAQIIDVKDPRNPRIIGLFPRPVAPKDAPYTDFCFARGRFGTHNIMNWVAPGTSRPEFVSMTYFNAGLRVFDISDPTQPQETAWFVGERRSSLESWDDYFRDGAETTLVEWDRNLIWVGTHTGTYCLSTPALGKPVLEPRKIEKWTLAHCNAGWDDATPTAFYFGRGLHELV